MAEHGATLQTYNQELVKGMQLYSPFNFVGNITSPPIYNVLPVFQMFVSLDNVCNCIALEDLKARRKEISKVVLQEEAIKLDLEKELAKIQYKLETVNLRLTEHKQIRDNYDQMINDAENGFKKVRTTIQLYYLTASYLSLSFNLMLAIVRSYWIFQ